MKQVALLFLSFFFLGASSAPIDKTREHLDNLKEKSTVKYDDYEYPYLTMQSARLFELSPAVLREKLKKQLEENKIEIPKVDFTKQTFPMPAVFTTGDQLEAIERCKANKCNVKLRPETESKLLEQAEKPKKLGMYHQMIVDRVNQYLKKGELKGYEEREGNAGAIVEMAKQQEFLKFRYPTTAAFIFSEGWKNRDKIKNSFLKNEAVTIAPDKLQPIWRVGEVFEFEENKTPIFFDLHVYTNHYFDASLTLYELMPVESKTALIITDVIEMDELKKSAFIRAFFKAKMVEAVSVSQDNSLKKLE